MTYTREVWARGVLDQVGNISPSQQIVNFLVAWTKFETSTGAGAAYNLLNTEQDYPNATNFNSAGVKNYPTFYAGCIATRIALENGRYEGLVGILKTNQNVTPNLYASIQADLNMWVKGSYTEQAYKIEDIVSIMGTGLQDEMPGITTSPVDPLYTVWTKNIPNLRYNSGISESWAHEWSTYGSPLSPELNVSEVIVQFFELSDCFWINGNPHWRLHP